MTVGEICNRTVIVAPRNTSVLDAARLMREHHVGSLVVVDETAKGRVPAGVLTDRDIVVAVVAGSVDAGTLRVGEVMSTDPVCARESDSVYDALQLARRRGVRRLPVTAMDGTLIGIVTTDDLLSLVAGELNDIVRAISIEQSRETRVRK